VRAGAKSLTDFINGVLFLRDKDRDVLRVGSVYENRSGQWFNTQFIEPPLLVNRDQFYQNTAQINETPANTPLESIWIQDAVSDDVVADVLSYLRAKPEWFELYKAFERMRDDINRELGQHQEQQIGWPERAKLDEFKKVRLCTGTRHRNGQVGLTQKRR
jgi:hypothetical protein